MREIPLASWTDFEPEIQRIAAEQQEREAKSGRHFGKVLFRGMANANWGVETTLERSYPGECCDATNSFLKYYLKVTSAQPAIETFSGKRWDKIPSYPKFRELLIQNKGKWFDWLLKDQPEVCEFLVYLRHHGFPSPLLDWTTSPYVAAFFAFDAPGVGTDRACIYALLRDAIHTMSSDQHLFVLGPYMRTHPRHLLQQCDYSMCVQMDFSADDYRFLPHGPAISALAGPQGELLKITVPIAEREVALKKLDLMNINPYSLFGSEDSLIRTAARRECLFRSWSL
jgi:FRG domain